jgi:tRNA pseudouridine65 synthase
MTWCSTTAYVFSHYGRNTQRYGNFSWGRILLKRSTPSTDASTTNLSLVRKLTTETSHLTSLPKERYAEDECNSSSRSVRILHQDTHCVVVSKPASVVCHHSYYTGSKGSKKTNKAPEVPMLQQVRRALKRQVNLIHRLDRGASGCLILTFRDEEDDHFIEEQSSSDRKKKTKGPTAQMVDALQSNNATKTYVALVRGTGMLHGENLMNRCWFAIDRPIKDERGILNNATTWFRFVSGYYNESTGARASLVLAKPMTGRWHQIRRHLNGLSHPILGDTVHGSSPINRLWREQFGLPDERICLHLGRVIIPPTEYTNCLDVRCPLPSDMRFLLQNHLPQVLEEAKPILQEEGIVYEEEEEGIV